MSAAVSQQENLSVVREIYAAVQRGVKRGDVAAILDRVTDDVDWSAEATGHVGPWHGHEPAKDMRRELLRRSRHQH
jgi:ketosteroid isomerase-like protein